jgi:hypothetical protein
VSGRLGHPIFSTARFWSRGELLGFARAAGATPERVRGALVLPPAIAGRMPGFERRLSARAHPLAGLTAFSMRGGSTVSGSPPNSSQKGKGERDAAREESGGEPDT